ncbi:MAG: hypothetical protein P8Z42_12685 [Anaerolineales bacterium]
MQHLVSEQPSARITVKKLGFWAAILAAIFSLLFAVLAIAYSPPDWAGIEAYAEGFDFLQMLNMIPVVLVTIAVIVVMACIHSIAPSSKKVFSLIAIAFSVVYASIISTNYYVQLFVVRLNLVSGNLEGLQLLAMPNLHSVFFALEALGYMFLSLATLFVLPVFGRGMLAGWIRAFLIISGGLGIFGTIVALFDLPLLIFAGLGLWSLTFPIAMIFVAVYFRSLPHE